jgi:hypothetical protein
MRFGDARDSEARIALSSVSMPWTVAPETPADRANLVNSLAPLAVWGCDVGNMVLSSKQAKFISEWGPAIVGSLGIVQMFVGLAAASAMEGDSKYTGCDQVGALMSGFSPVCKWLTYVAGSSPPASTIGCAVSMAAFDTCDDLVVPILSLFSDA